MQEFFKDVLQFTRDMPLVFRALLVCGLALVLLFIFKRCAKIMADPDKVKQLWGFIPALVIVIGLICFVAFANSF